MTQFGFESLIRVDWEGVRAEPIEAYKPYKILDLDYLINIGPKLCMNIHNLSLILSCRAKTKII